MNNLFRKYFHRASIVLFILLAAFALLTACEEVIDIDTDFIDQKIVIDGAVSDKPDGSRVLISLTTNAFKSGGEQNVSGAIVIVSDDAGNSESLIESSSGKYSFSSMHAQQGRTYNIKVEYGGMEYTGISTLNSPMQIDSIRFDQTYSTSIWFWQFPSYKTKLYLKNRPGIDEYCIIKISNGNNSATIVYQDKFAHDEPIVLEETNTTFQYNDRVTVELLTIDKNAYEYFFRLNELSDENGLDIPEILNINTYNPKSNLSNGALGYFYAYSYKKYTATVK